MNCESYAKASNLVDIFEGQIPVIFYDSSSGKYVPYSVGIEATEFVIGELISLLGRDNVVPK